MIVELFSCAGGLAEGFRRAGLCPDLAIDFDPDACGSYAANLGRAPVRLDVRELLRFVTELHGWIDIDLLLADPPCAPWSRAGARRGLSDSRDVLQETCALIATFQPRAWLLGNIPGLDDGPNLPTVQKVIGALGCFAGGTAPTRGYCIDFATLDAADYGVPQHRTRPFWYGHRAGSPCIAWPARTHVEPSPTLAMPFAELPHHVTCAEALSHLEPPDLGMPVALAWRTRQDRRRAAAAGVLVVDPAHPPSRADRPANVVRAGRGSGSRVCVEPWPWASRPATSVTCDDVLAPPGKTGGPGHPNGYGKRHAGAIKLSEKAAAILQGFPETWVFSGKTKRARWEQIGQAVPPPLAHAIASAVAVQLGAGKKRKCPANEQGAVSPTGRCIACGAIHAPAKTAAP